MIHKNATVGELNSIYHIELGKGDVQVNVAQWPSEGAVSLTFKQDVESHPIGTGHNHAGTTTDEVEPNALISFSNIESLEVVQRALDRARIYLRNIHLKSEV